MNGGGHRIAWRLTTNHVTDITRKALMNLNLDPNNVDFKSEVNPNDADFISLATEPDNDKQMERMHSNGCSSEAGDHFNNIPTAPPGQQALLKGIKPPSGPDATDKVTQSIADLQTYAQALKSGGSISPDVQNKAAQAMRWLAHETGDLFGQPLHCINRFSQAFPAPKGDEGGNSVNLPGLFPPAVKYQELHAYCDGMGIDPTAPAKGSFATPFAAEASGPVNAAELAKIDAKVTLIEKAYPSKSFTIKQLTTPDISSPQAIASSLGQIAQENATAAEGIYSYHGSEIQSGTKIAPNDPWLTSTTNLLHQRAALGSYRMAYLLDMIFDPTHAAQAAIGTGPVAPAAINLAVTGLTNPSEPAATGSTPTPTSSKPPAHGHSPRPTPASPSAHSTHSTTSGGTSTHRSHTTA